MDIALLYEFMQVNCVLLFSEDQFFYLPTVKFCLLDGDQWRDHIPYAYCASRPMPSYFRP